MRTFFSALIVIACASCGVFLACHKNNPIATQPAHDAFALRANSISTRWVQLAWKNDSAAPSRTFMLLRNGVDTVFAGMSVKDTITVIDSGLVPSTNYSYQIFRMVNGVRWDSASLAVRTLDTTRDAYVWTKTKLGGAGSVLYSVWGASPNSVWMCGSFDSSGGNFFNVAHYTASGLQYFNLVGGNPTYSGCYGLSDSSIYFVGFSSLAHYDGKNFYYVFFYGDSAPVHGGQLNSVWVSPDDREIFAFGNSGTVIHRKSDGKTWEVQASGTTLNLGSPVAFSPTDIYACGGNATDEGILLHYNGIAWTTVNTSTPPNDTILNVGAMVASGNSSDSLYLVGNGVYHRAGNIWQNRTPRGSLVEYMYGIYSTSWNNVIVCGAFGCLMHFNGEKFTVYPNFFSLSSTLNLVGVWMGGNEVFVVGADDNGAYLIHGK